MGGKGGKVKVSRQLAGIFILVKVYRAILRRGRDEGRGSRKTRADFPKDDARRASSISLEMVVTIDDRRADVRVVVVEVMLSDGRIAISNLLVVQWIEA